jgi:hypothetical protein
MFFRPGSKTGRKVCAYWHIEARRASEELAFPARWHTFLACASGFKTSFSRRRASQTDPGRIRIDAYSSWTADSRSDDVRGPLPHASFDLRVVLCEFPELPSSRIVGEHFAGFDLVDPAMQVHLVPHQA